MNLASEKRALFLVAWILYGMILFGYPWFHLALDQWARCPGAQSGPVRVRVIGEVQHPGIYAFPGSSTVLRAISAAGPTPATDLQRLNLSASLMQETVLRVPSIHAGFRPVIFLNRSMAEELMKIPGVGPTLAGRIVESRTEKGGFQDPEDLLRVPGIGRGKLRQIMKHAVLK